MAFRITHSTVTGAPADPKALVDGPAFDADHVIQNPEDLPVSTATQAALDAKANLAGGNALTGDQSVIGNTTSGITANGAQVTVQNSSLKNTDIYNPVVPTGWFTYDGVRSVVDIPPGTTATNVNAFGFWVRSRVAEGGFGQNAVGLAGLAIADVDGAAVWGLNPVVADNRANGLVVQGARKIIGAEFDFAVNSVTTTVQGISLLGTAYAQPIGANGVTVGSLSVQSPGTIKWSNAFVVENGAATTAFYVGAVAVSGNDIPSMPLNLAYFDNTGTGKAAQFFVNRFGYYMRSTGAANNLVIGFASTGNAPALTAEGSDTNINLALAAKGTGSITTANPVALGSTLAVTGVATFTAAPVFTAQAGTRTALGLGTAATQNTGTSGANLPFMNGANTWSAQQTISSSSGYGLDLNGSTTVPIRLPNGRPIVGRNAAGTLEYNLLSINGSDQLLLGSNITNLFLGSGSGSVYSNANSFPNGNNLFASGDPTLRWSGVYGVIGNYTASVSAHSATAIPAGGTAGAGLLVSSTANFGVFFGSGAPTLSAAKGSLYLRSDGSGTSDRMYVNTNGSTTWTNVTTAA